MKNSIVNIMGGGTAGWISALYILNKNKDLNLNLKVNLISSNTIEPIGVGEGTTPSFAFFIENICKIDRKEFLRETKGSLKYGVKFVNWNFDNDYHYNLVFAGDVLEQKEKQLDYDFIQYIINNDISVPQKVLQRKLIGNVFDIIENNKISLQMIPTYAYHFSASLIIPFLMKRCFEFQEFSHVEGKIENVNYHENGYIKSVKTDNNLVLDGNFFINCLGFNSKNILDSEYFDIEGWEDYILNDSAFAIQVKNSPFESLEPYTTAFAKEYGWCWKIPQYEKTGYGYVYSSSFINDEEKLYDDLIKTYNIKEKSIFKTRVVKSKPYYNKKQIHKNCLSLGLSSGFVEPLEATSINMTLVSLQTFFDFNQNHSDFEEKHKNIFNEKMQKNWINVFKFIIFHYFTNNPINDYWKHYKQIQKNNLFEFYEKFSESQPIFSKSDYFSISLGMKMKDFYYDSFHENYLKEHVDSYLRVYNTFDFNDLYSHNQVLHDINLQKNLKTIVYG